MKKLDINNKEIINNGINSEKKINNKIDKTINNVSDNYNQNNKDQLDKIDNNNL